VKYALIAVILALSAAGAARAAEDLSCRNGSFPAEQAPFGLAMVTPGDRLGFLSDTDGCPSEAAKCRGRAYVLAGNVLATGHEHGPYVCAFFPNRVGGTAGWAPRARLAPMAFPAAPAPAAWAGHWADGDDTIDLAVKAGAIEASGQAYWPSANPPLSERPGGPNLGDLSAKARPAANHASFTDDPCTAAMTLAGDYLIVADNGQCGGMNVRFDGVYRRGKR
jgi:hypothetical protein